jgi:ribosome maturation factor RimP
VSLDAVADLSREISATLDSAEETGGEFSSGEYVLEVSSPGVDRPLTQPRHWRRNVGRLVAVSARERPLTGRVVAASDTGIVLEVEGRRHEFGYAEVGPGRVQIEFGRLDEVSDKDLAEFADGQDEQEEDEA